MGTERTLEKFLRMVGMNMTTKLLPRRVGAKREGLLMVSKNMLITTAKVSISLIQSIW